jgi:hypothetical protein
MSSIVHHPRQEGATRRTFGPRWLERRRRRTYTLLKTATAPCIRSPITCCKARCVISKSPGSTTRSAAASRWNTRPLVSLGSPPRTGSRRITVSSSPSRSPIHSTAPCRLARRRGPDAIRMPNREERGPARCGCLLRAHRGSAVHTRSATMEIPLRTATDRDCRDAKGRKVAEARTEGRQMICFV